MSRPHILKRMLAPGANSHEPDKSIIFALAVLLIFGLVMLFSASWAVSYSAYHNTYHFLLRQAANIGVGLVAFFLASKIDYHWWRKFASLFLLISIILLVLVFIPGLRSEYGTARSWINLFGYSFQPSELVKVSFLIYLATWLEAKKDSLSSFGSGLFPFLVSLGVISALMIAQPDLGTLFIIVFTAFVVFFAGGGKVAHIAMLVVLGGLLVYLMFSLHSSYQSDRFKCLKDPSYSAQDKCYQINQSLIAIGSGGWFGRGLGQSRQKFMYLPEVWADSIFPIIAEETGFVVCLLLILLYLFLFYRGLLVARDAPDTYGGMLAIGIVIWLAVQTFLNIGGMVNLIPMTGVPLPFISSGGSAMLSSLLAMGILVNISRHTKMPIRRR